MLVYMRHIIEALDRARVDVKREDFAAMASAIEYFPGVTTWFERMNAYVKKRSKGAVKLQHYLISRDRRRSSRASPFADTSSASTPPSITSTITASQPFPSCW